LDDFGFKAIIAPSFADIFYNNCLKNGLLPIVLPAKAVSQLFAEQQPGYYLDIDLPSQTVTTPTGEALHFQLDSERKHRLINGLDDIALTLQKTAKIVAYEQQRAQCAPWLFSNNPVKIGR
jgi:3-isopropylmalate/(R)-2-methylmalate dehydratase small subunit